MEQKFILKKIQLKILSTALLQCDTTFLVAAVTRKLFEIVVIQ